MDALGDRPSSWSPTRSASAWCPSTGPGRLFRDLLGTVNQRFAAACDEVHLVVAGRVLKL